MSYFEHRHDCENLARMAGNHGVEISPQKAYYAWLAYSVDRDSEWFAPSTGVSPVDVAAACRRYLRSLPVPEIAPKKRANRDRLEIPGDWAGRDRHLSKLARLTGFQTVNRLMTHVAYEVSYCKSPAVFYRALAQFFEMSRKKAARKKSNV